MYMAKNNVKGAGFVTSAPMAGAVSNGGGDAWERSDFQADRRHAWKSRDKFRLISRRTRRIENLAIKRHWRDELD